MRRFSRYVGVVVLIALAVVVAALFAGRNHVFAADRPPSAIETAIARRLVLLSIPRSARAQVNPSAGDEGASSMGARHFQEHCAMCHGVDGRGHTSIAENMYPPVPDLADTAIQQMDDGALFAVIQNGVRWTGMPAFRSTHSPEEIWQLVSFVRHVPHMAETEDAAHTHAPNATPRTGPTVIMDGTRFVPARLTVAAGETVTWTNSDPFPHNVSSTSGGFHSPDVLPGSEWSVTPTTAGEFTYVCTLHPGMTGTLVVR